MLIHSCLHTIATSHVILSPRAADDAGGIFSDWVIRVCICLRLFEGDFASGTVIRKKKGVDNGQAVGAKLRH